MKKALTVFLALAIALCFAACGGPDLTAVTESYNNCVDIYNEIAGLVTENGWDRNTDTVNGINEYYTQLEDLAAVIQAKDITQEQADSCTKTLDSLAKDLTAIKDTVSVVYVDTRALNEYYTQAGDVYDQVVAAANDNGYTEDSDTMESIDGLKAELDDIAATLEGDGYASQEEADAVSDALHNEFIPSCEDLIDMMNGKPFTAAEEAQASPAPTT